MMTHREKDLNLSSDLAEYFFFTTESQNQVKDYIRVIYQKYSPWTDGTITLDLHNRNTYFHQLSQQWFKTDPTCWKSSLLLTKRILTQDQEMWNLSLFKKKLIVAKIQFHRKNLSKMK